MSTKSACHWWSIPYTTTWRLGNLRLVGLCKVYVSWDCNHSLTSFFVYPFGLNLLRPHNWREQLRCNRSTACLQLTPFVVSTTVLKVDPVLDFFPSASWCFWGVQSNRGGTLLSFTRSRCSFRLSDESPAVLVTNQILWNICFSEGLSECFSSLWVEIFPFAQHLVD
jgi:hypothetical protein